MIGLKKSEIKQFTSQKVAVFGERLSGALFLEEVNRRRIIVLFGFDS
jgi:hypothetical protein